jgi:hypothetical protein
MKRSKIIPIVIAPLLLVSSAMSQLRDWEAVQALPEGTMIKVQLHHGSTFGHCSFDRATDKELACSIRGSIFFYPVVRQHVYPRSNVKAVFRTHNGTLIGIGVGAGAGAAIGASRSTSYRGANALFGAVALGAVGAVVGTAADPFFHGKAVYRSQKNSPAAPQKPQNPAPDPNQQNAASPEPKIPCLRDGTTLQCVDQ